MNSHVILRSLLSSTVKTFKKNIHTTSSYKLPEVWQPDKKGRTYNKIYDKKSPEEEEWEKLGFIEKLKGEIQLFKEEFKLWTKEFTSRWDGPILTYRTGEVDVVWRFNEDPKCLEKWICSTDSDNGEGYSTAE